MKSFSLSSLPQIEFGEGAINKLPELIKRNSDHLLIVTGGNSFIATDSWINLQQELADANIRFEHVTVTNEPSPELVDEIVSNNFEKGIGVVVGIGGGSVLDCAKAVAGLLPYGNSVLDHLEDVGKGIAYLGPALPLIAVPTTAGTGSEATKNAVLSHHGKQGYKKSFRHNTLVPQYAVVDPQLLQTAPPHLIATQGMDAFTQLLESFVSLRANNLTDALAWSGLEAVIGGFSAAWHGGESQDARDGRAAMAYGAMISGITLAQTGLGSVHGLAQPLGSLFPVPHGVACGATVTAATQMNLQVMIERDPQNEALNKYDAISELIKDYFPEFSDGRRNVVKLLKHWCYQFSIPTLSRYGIKEEDIPIIVGASRNNSMKTNPVLLSDDEIATVVRESL